ncbi:hypothetical protein Tco_0258073 [Tanacetum coccineum]
MANNTPIITTVQNIGAKEQTPREDKRKEVQDRLDFGGKSKKFRRIKENSRESGAENPPVRYRRKKKRQERVQPLDPSQKKRA